MTQRPASFDARLMKYLPGIEKLASKYVPPQYVGELINDTIVHCLENWKSFRQNGNFWQWIKWRMYHVRTNQVKVAMNRRRIAPTTSIDDCVDRSIAPRQHEITELSLALDKLDNKKGAILLRRAMGETTGELARDLGVSTARICQHEAYAREKYLGVR